MPTQGQDQEPKRTTTTSRNKPSSEPGSQQGSGATNSTNTTTEPTLPETLRLCAGAIFAGAEQDVARDISEKFTAAAAHIEWIEGKLESAASEARAWETTAANYGQTADFYRGLLNEIGNVFGDAARTSDDGSIQDDVLVSKLPELVRLSAESLKASESTHFDRVVEILSPWLPDEVLAAPQPIDPQVVVEKLKGLITCFQEYDDVPKLPIVAANLVLEEFARQDRQRASNYVRLPREAKDRESREWRVTWVDRESVKVPRPNLTEEQLRSFHPDTTDSQLFMMEKRGTRGVRLTCLGHIDGARAASEIEQKVAEDYAVAERQRRSLEGERNKLLREHNDRYPADRYAEERDRAFEAFESRREEAETKNLPFDEEFDEARFVPPPFRYHSEARYIELQKQCEDLKRHIEELKKSTPSTKKTSFFFPEDEPIRFVIV